MGRAGGEGGMGGEPGGAGGEMTPTLGTPADIASAIQTAAAAAFRDARATQPDRRLQTVDVRRALHQTTPTISEAARERFASEAERFIRA